MNFDIDTKNDVFHIPVLSIYTKFWGRVHVDHSNHSRISKPMMWHVIDFMAAFG